MNSYDISQWQGVGESPPPGGEGPKCQQCGVGRWVELGGGDARDALHPNIDVRNIAGVDIVHDFRTGTLPLHDEHADFIKIIHVLNHISLVNARSLLKECFRVLRPSGHVFIMVTDLEFLVKQMAEDGCQEDWLLGMYGTRGDSYDDDFHHWGYTAASLERELVTAGFTEIVHRGYYNRWEFKMEAQRP